MVKKELKIQVPLLIKSYLPIAFISSIAFANQGNSSWIMNNFIQLFIPENKKKLESFPFQDFMYCDQNIFQINDINDNNYMFRPDKIIHDIVYWINHNNYVVVYVDEYEIPKSLYYQERHILHSQLIYGYDIEQQEFLALNFLKNNHIGKFSISFNVLNKAIFSDSTKQLYLDDKVSWTNRDTIHRIILIRYLSNREEYYNHEINFRYILNELNNYYLSINSSNSTGYFTGELFGTWGMNVYAKIIEILNATNGGIDYRIFHTIYEHKVYMVERLKLFEISEQHLTKILLIRGNSDILRKLCIKYNITGNNDILIRMIKLVKSIRDDENYVLYHTLKKYGYNVQFNKFNEIY